MHAKPVLSVLLVALLLAGPAHAHTGVHLAFSISAGLSHPLGGIDHLLAMFAVGLLGVQLGGRAVILVPGAFVTTMLVAALAGFAGIEIPGAELGVAVSVVAIALPVAFALGMPPVFAMAFVGFFALFHGFAHGAEVPVGHAAAPYMFGFACSTALIHAAGVAFGLASSQVTVLKTGQALRAAGGAIALAGAVLVIA